MGGDESHFNVSVGQDSVHKPQPFWRERRAEAVSNWGPSAYQPNALPPGQTGSPGDVPLSEFMYLVSTTCQVRVTINDTGLCYCVCVTSFERYSTPLCVDSAVLLDIGWPVSDENSACSYPASAHTVRWWRPSLSVPVAKSTHIKGQKDCQVNMTTQNVQIFGVSPFFKRKQ